MASFKRSDGTLNSNIYSKKVGFTTTGIDDNATSTAITIDSSENVGIGTTGPSTKLQVAGDITATAFAGSGANLTGIDAATVATTAPSSPATGDLWFDSTSGTTAMKVWSGTQWDQLSNKFSASGGTVTTSGGYKYHTFTSSGTFTAETSGSVDILMVGGGGGGGGYGGGGGGGAVLHSVSKTLTPTTYAITIGAGAVGKQSGVTGSTFTGGSTTAFSQTATGGGTGGRYNNVNGSDGANGGGAGAYGDASNEEGAGVVPSTDSYTTAYCGFDGGDCNTIGPSYPCGGGGGATAVGGYGNGNVGGVGGAGKLVSSMSSYYWAGGGGGCVYATSGTGGAGGIGGGGGGTRAAGGAGLNSGGAGTNNSTPGANGGANTGGGGGGNEYISGTGVGGAGGSGIVIVRYVV